MPARTLRPGNRERKRDAGTVNFSSGQTSKRHWLGGGHRPSPAPRILASVRPGRARDSLPTLGEPAKGFRPHRAPSLVRLRAAQGLDARHHAASAVSMLPGRRGSSEHLRCLVPGGRRHVPSGASRCGHPHRIALRKEAAVWPARRKPSGCGTERLCERVFFGFRDRRRQSERERGGSRTSGRTLKGTKPRKDRAPPAGNGRKASRTRRRSKASKQALPSGRPSRVGSGNGADRRRRARQEGTARGQRPR
jgi:hypothetical protein